MFFGKWFEDGIITTVQNPKTYTSYHLLSVLGEGTFGTTFLVVEPVTQIEYAAKLIHLYSPEDHERFNHEVQAHHRLSTISNIVRLVDAFVMDWHYIYQREVGVIITELMEGDLISHPLDSSEVVPLLKSVLEALVAIHQRGMAHRDIKPANILRRELDFKVADLGLVCGDEPKCTMIGTKRYMSPLGRELQGRNVPVELSQAEDVWALGITLLECLFGRPFANRITDLKVATQNQIYAILDTALWGELQLVDMTPQRLRHLLRKMLTYDSNVTARDILDDLDAENIGTRSNYG